MSIKKYETLLQTVDLGSLTRAAELLGYTQSAISHMLTGLEEELGLRLIVRDRSGVRLTPEGQRLLPSIRQVVKANQEVLRQVAEYHGLEEGGVRIGTILSISVHLLPDLLASFSQLHPKLEFELLQGRYEDIERWISEGRIDCGFVRLPLLLQHLDHDLLLEEEILAIFPENRSLEEGPFPVEHLREEPFILRPDALEVEMRAILKKSSCRPKITYSAKDDCGVMAMVERGLGMSIMPELLLRGERHRLKKKSLDPKEFRKICLAYKEFQTLPPAARQFVEFTRSWFSVSFEECENSKGNFN